MVKRNVLKECFNFKLKHARRGVISTLVTVCLGVCIAGGGHSARAQTTLPLDEASKAFTYSTYADDAFIKRHVDFWIRIYSHYTTQQGLIHDSKYIDRVYEVLSFDGLSRREATRLVKQSKRKWTAVLKSVHKKQGKPDTLDADEKHVYEMYSDLNDANRYLAATRPKRLRFQLGQSDRFKQALVDSGPFIQMMEKAFKEEGMPLELTRLPFVESSFNVKARSKVGASGIWQFIRSTGRLFMTINDAVDDRNDPYLATRAAARLLRQNYESLESWPLAVTAYNHGRKGMMRAQRQVVSNVVSEVLQQYKSRMFGFASQNFFMEFLAAVEVEKNAEHYFGKVERGAPEQFVEVGVADFISFKILTQELGLPREVMADLNTGLTKNVINGNYLIPAGYVLRIPPDWSPLVQKKVESSSAGIPGVSTAQAALESVPSGVKLSALELKEAFAKAYGEIPAKHKQRHQVGGGRHASRPYQRK